MVDSTGDRLRGLVSESMDPRTAGLLIEAGRIADRLDQIDGIITGKSDWIELMRFRVDTGDELVVKVTLDGVLAEARQQATTLRGILAQIGVPHADAVVKGRSISDELRERRLARETQRAAEASGSASS